MDLNAERLAANAFSRWAKSVALVFFAVSCVLLITSLARAQSNTHPMIGVTNQLVEAPQNRTETRTETLLPEQVLP